MDIDKSTHHGPDQIDGPTSRQMAAEAAASGDAWACVVAVVRGPLFDGLVRRLVRFEHVDADLAYDLFADALDLLYVTISDGGEVRDPVAWVRRVALNQATDLETERRRETRYDPDLDYRQQQGDDGDGVSRDVLRREALRVCWSVVDQISQTRPRAVVRLMLEAIDAGRPDGMPASDIAERLGMTLGAVHTARTRGLQALVELIRTNGHALTLDFARRLEDEIENHPDPVQQGA